MLYINISEYLNLVFDRNHVNSDIINVLMEGKIIFFLVFFQRDPFWTLIFRKLSLTFRKIKINYCDICNLLLFKCREKQVWLECFLFEILILFLCCICSHIFSTSKMKVCQGFCYGCNNHWKFNLQSATLISNFFKFIN